MSNASPLKRHAKSPLAKRTKSPMAKRHAKSPKRTKSPLAKRHAKSPKRSPMAKRHAKSPLAKRHPKSPLVKRPKSPLVKRPQLVSAATDRVLTSFAWSAKGAPIAAWLRLPRADCHKAVMKHTMHAWKAGKLGNVAQGTAVGVGLRKANVVCSSPKRLTKAQAAAFRKDKRHNPLTGRAISPSSITSALLRAAAAASK